MKNDELLGQRLLTEDDTVMYCWTFAYCHGLLKTGIAQDKMPCRKV